MTIYILGTLNTLADALSRQIPILRMMPLLVNSSYLLGFLQQVPIQIGRASPYGTLLICLTPHSLPASNFLITTATPDLPFLHVHILRRNLQQTKRQGWIITPALPTAHQPLPNVHLIAPLPPLIDKTITPWLLLG